MNIIDQSELSIDFHRPIRAQCYLHEERVEIIAIVLQLQSLLNCLLCSVIGLESHLQLRHVISQIVVILVLHRLLVIVESLAILMSLLQRLTNQK